MLYVKSLIQSDPLQSDFSELAGYLMNLKFILFFKLCLLLYTLFPHPIIAELPLLLHVVPGTCCSASMNLTWCHGKMITHWGHDISNKNSKATWGHQLPVCLRLAETRHLLTSAYSQLSLFQHHSFFLQHAPDLRPDLSHIRKLFLFCPLNNILLISPLLVS